MKVTFKNHNNIIVQTIENDRAYTRDNQYLSIAEYIWCLASSIGIEQGLVIHSNNLRSSINQTKQPTTPTPSDVTTGSGVSIADQMLESAELCIAESIDWSTRYIGEP
jgi:hypothetical protein